MTIARFSYIFVLSSYNIWWFFCLLWVAHLVLSTLWKMIKILLQNIWKKWRKISHLLQIIIQVIKWTHLEPKMFTMLCIFECNILLSTCYCRKDFSKFYGKVCHISWFLFPSHLKKKLVTSWRSQTQIHTKNCEFTFRLTGIDIEYMYYLPKIFLLNKGLSCSIFL